MDGLFGQPARRILEDGNKMMRDVVSVEHGRARLERRGDAVLERHDNSSIKESVYSTKRDDGQCSLQRRQKSSPKICLSPAQPIVCHSSFTKTNPMKHTQKASLLMIELLPAAARDPTSWEKKKEGWERDPKKADPAGKLYR